jgi:hypothetical protein
VFLSLSQSFRLFSPSWTESSVIRLWNHSLRLTICCHSERPRHLRNQTKQTDINNKQNKWLWDWKRSSYCESSSFVRTSDSSSPLMTGNTHSETKVSTSLSHLVINNLYLFFQSFLIFVNPHSLPCFHHRHRHSHDHCSHLYEKKLVWVTQYSKTHLEKRNIRDLCAQTNRNEVISQEKVPNSSVVGVFLGCSFFSWWNILHDCEETTRGTRKGHPFSVLSLCSLFFVWLRAVLIRNTTQKCSIISIDCKHIRNRASFLVRQKDMNRRRKKQSEKKRTNVISLWFSRVIRNSSDKENFSLKKTENFAIFLGLSQSFSTSISGPSPSFKCNSPQKVVIIFAVTQATTTI